MKGNPNEPKARGTPIVSRQQQHAALERELRWRRRRKPEPPTDPALVKLASEVQPGTSEKASDKQKEGLASCRQVRTCPHCGQTRFEYQCHCLRASVHRSSGGGTSFRRRGYK